MKQSAYFSIALFLFMVSCSDEVPIIFGGPQKPVVYGLFNPKDTIILIRLTKTFVGLESAEVLAKDPNNLYYDNAEVRLDINSEEGYPVTSYAFEKTILPDKPDGIFARSPNYAYVLKGPLDLFFIDGFQVRLLINLPDDSLLLSAQQTYYSPPEFTLPKPHSQTHFGLYQAEAPKIKWVDKYGFQRYLLVIRLNYMNRYEDYNELTSFEVNYSHRSLVFSPEQNSATAMHIFEGNDFLRKISYGITVDPKIVNRSFMSIDLILIGLSKEYCDYKETSLIVSDRMGKPVSNIVGGLGLFALQVYTEQTGHLLDPSSLDSLVNGQHTRKLKFVKY